MWLGTVVARIDGLGRMHAEKVGMGAVFVPVQLCILQPFYNLCFHDRAKTAEDVLAILMLFYRVHQVMSVY